MEVTGKGVALTTQLKTALSPSSTRLLTGGRVMVGGTGQHKKRIIKYTSSTVEVMNIKAMVYFEGGRRPFHACWRAKGVHFDEGMGYAWHIRMERAEPSRQGRGHRNRGAIHHSAALPFTELQMIAAGICTRTEHEIEGCNAFVSHTSHALLIDGA
jgi:hypothetical protein